MRDSRRKPVEQAEALRARKVKLEPLRGDDVEHKKAEETLRENEQRLLRAQQIAHIGDWDRDFVANKVRWSEELYRIFGLNPDDFEPTYERFLKLIHPDDREIVKAVTANAVSGKQSFSVDYRIVRPDGTQRAVHSQGQVHTYSTGQVSTICGTVQDITDRKKAEEALRESEEMFRSIFETSLVGVAICSTDKKWMYVNNQICKILGYCEQELRQTTWEELTHPEDLEADVSQYNRLLAGEIENYNLEKRFIRKDGSVVYARIYISCKRNQHGAVEYDIGLLEDITERKLAEEGLKRERDKAQKYLDVAAVMMVAIDSEQRVVLINKKGCEILGYSEDEILGKNWFDNFLPERVRDDVKQIFEKVLHGDVDAQEYYENPVLTKNGEERLIAWHNTVLKDDKGEVIASLSSGESITERKKAEEALRDSETRLLTAQHVAQMGFLDWNLKTNEMYWSPEVYRLYGIDPEKEKATIERTMQLVHPCDLEFVRKNLDMALKDVKKYDIDHRKLCPDGKVIWVHAQADLIRDAEGNPESLLGTVVDITERKKAEEALRESEEKYREIVELAPDGIVTVDLKGMITSCNTALLEQTGYSKEDFVGKHISKIPTARLKDIPKYLKLFTSLLRGKVPEPFEFVWIHKDGTKHWGDVRVSILKRDNRTVGFQAITRNITERKKAEEAYRSLVDHSLQGLAIFQDGRVVFTNEAMAEITGYTVKEMLAMSSEQVQAFVHPEDRELVWSRHQQRLNGEKVPDHYELRGIRKDGSTCWLEIHASGIEYQGRPAIQAACVDITERKKVEKALRKSEEHYRTLAESMNEGLAQIDQDGRYVYANRKLGEILGYSPDEIVGRHWTRFYDRDARKKVRSKLIERRKGIAEPYEVATTTKDGRRMHLHISPQPIFDAEGKFKGSMAIVMDITERKHAEETLQRTTKELQVILDSVPAGIWYKDTENKFLRVNKAGAESIGMKVEDIEGRAVSDIFPEDAKHYYEDDLEVIESGRPKLGIIERMQVPGGEKKWVHTDKVLHWDEQGNVAGIIAFVQDITDRKKAEEEIGNLAKFPSENPCPVLRIEANGTILYANAASNNFLNDKNSGLDRPAPRQWRQLVADVLDTGLVERIEVEHAGRVIAFRAVPVVDAHYVNFYGMDITERKEAERALRDSENKLKTYINNIAMGISIISPKMEVLDMNEILKGWFPQVDISKKPKCYKSFYHPPKEEICTYCPTVKAFRDEKVHFSETDLCMDGNYYQVTAAPLKDDKGNITAVIETVQNITNRKKAEQEARDAQQRLIEQQRHEKEYVEAELVKARDELIRTTRLAAIGQVSASIAHDLRNPLGSVRNASYFLRRRLSKDDPKTSEHLAIIDQEVVKADQIITNLLAMAQPRAPNKQPVNLAEMVDEVFSRARRTEAVRCLTSFVPDPFVVLADPNQLWQAISNIVANAADAMKGHGEFIIEATRGSDCDTLVFRDTGPGFAPEVIDKLFEPLVTTKASGTGLGLTICRDIVEKHGGTIDAENCQGRGAAIRIRLPRQ